MKANNQTDYLEMYFPRSDQKNYCRIRHGVLQFGVLRSAYSSNEAQTTIPLNRIDVYFYTPKKRHESSFGGVDRLVPDKLTFILVSGKTIDVIFDYYCNQDLVTDVLKLLEENIGRCGGVCLK